MRDTRFDRFGALEPYLQAIDRAAARIDREDHVLAPPPGRSPQASACEPYRDLIEQAVAQRRPAMAIWQDLVDDHGFSARYSSVQRFVGKLLDQWIAEAHPRIETAPGEEGQVDYGDGPMVRDPTTGKYQAMVRLSC